MAQEAPIAPSTAEASAPLASPRVRLLTLNLFLRPPLVHSHASDHKESRLERFLTHVLPNYDVVCLQECFSFATDRRKQIVERAKQMGFVSSVASPEGGWFKARVDGGLLILSRKEVVAEAKIVFPRGVHSDWLAAKGVIYAKIQLSPSSTLHLFTTHLQASYGPQPPESPSLTVRLAQIRATSTFISTTLSTHPPSPDDIVLLCGDLNVNGRPSHDAVVGTLHGDEYVRMMEALPCPGRRIRDLLYETCGEHPITTGTLFEGTVKASESSIDYVMRIVDDPPPTPSEEKVVVRELKREEFKVDAAEGLPYTNISDHMGVSCVLEVVNA
ncbi:hypothetical protein HKX48_002052 [Thoreauomyces humboldtii]|nr:hypothetical protein HKX48_002052 [Thoreauomyces humboldtii]